MRGRASVKEWYQTYGVTGDFDGEAGVPVRARGVDDVDDDVAVGVARARAPLLTTGVDDGTRDEVELVAREVGVAREVVVGVFASVGVDRLDADDRPRVADDDDGVDDDVDGRAIVAPPLETGVAIVAFCGVELVVVAEALEEGGGGVAAIADEAPEAVVMRADGVCGTTRPWYTSVWSSTRHTAPPVSRSRAVRGRIRTVTLIFSSISMCLYVCMYYRDQE